ncbi:hypothetical protein OFC05_28670, partial [Escherichia coli]|nr:hypothetical protein [Escherichia coli]
AQTTAQMAQAAQRTSDARMQALAAAAAGLHLYNNAGEIGKAAEAIGQGDVSAAASLQISVGSAHSHSVSHTQATEARASTVAAGGDVRLR